MSGWIFAIGLALLSLVVLMRVLKVPRAGFEAAAAALLLGLAGYAAQGHPAMPGQPTANAEELAGEKLAGKASLSEQDKERIANPNRDKRLVTADALLRQGLYADAADILRGAVRADPRNGEAWLTLANAMVLHAQGNLSPAARYAYAQAVESAPENPAPAFYYGLALLQSGQLQEGRAQWQGMLDRSPKDAPWRAELAARIAELDGLVGQATAGKDGQ